MDFKIRLFHETDIEFALAQTRREGWDPTRETFEIHLAHDPDGCFIAVDGDAPVGLVTTTRYEKTGWIGELIVTPELRGRGIGTLLMKHAIRFLETSGFGTLRLEADPPGIPIYTKLGFVHELESPRFRLDRIAPVSADSLSVASQVGVDEIAALDKRSFGDDRKKLLETVLARARSVFQVRRRKESLGYLVVQPSAEGARLGPWVAVEPLVAEELLRAALADLSEGAVVVASPGVNRPARDLLATYGFTETPSSFRMVRGPREAGGELHTIYGITSGAFG